MFAIVRADDLPQPFQRRVAIGSAPPVGCVTITSKGIVSPSGDDRGGLSGDDRGLYVNKSKIAVYMVVMDRGERGGHRRRKDLYLMAQGVR